MAALGADLCLAFRLTGPSPGTDDMVRRCRALGIPVRPLASESAAQSAR